VIILLLSESVNDKDAFSFLNEVKNELLKNFSIDELMNTNGLQLNRGTEILKKKMGYYNSHPITTSNGEIIENLNLAKDAMIENIEAILERNDKIDIIAQKSDSLKDISNNVSNVVENLRNRESERKTKYTFYMVILIGIIILILLYTFVLK
jgi:vesicle-associated membrane protein 7